MRPNDPIYHKTRDDVQISLALVIPLIICPFVFVSRERICCQDKFLRQYQGMMLKKARTKIPCFCLFSFSFSFYFFYFCLCIYSYISQPIRLILFPVSGMY